MNGQNFPARVITQLLAVFALVFIAGSVSAHTGLKSSNPGDGAIVNHQPEQLHLTFTAEVALVRISITDQADQQLKLDFTPSTERHADYHITLPAIPAGRFKVEWAAIGEDGHTVTDTFSYVVDPTAEASTGRSSDDHHGH